MENSGKILFGEPKPEWYVASGVQWVGPLTSEEVYERILSHQLTWAHYVWRKDQSQWKRICEVEEFQSSLPTRPASMLRKEILEKEAGKPAVRKSARKLGTPSEDRLWYLHFNDSQFGPFSVSEIERFLTLGKIHSRVHVWRDGMKNWERLEKNETFKKNVKLTLPVAPEFSQVGAVREEQREEPRRPLVAKILMADEQSVIVGVCRDISTGGLQVLADTIPANVGARLKMNISPTADAGKKIEAFVAEGVIVRILEDGRGFSFRFEKLSESAKQAIENYVNSAV